MLKRTIYIFITVFLLAFCMTVSADNQTVILDDTSGYEDGIVLEKGASALEIEFTLGAVAVSNDVEVDSEDTNIVDVSVDATGDKIVLTPQSAGITIVTVGYNGETETTSFPVLVYSNTLDPAHEQLSVSPSTKTFTCVVGDEIELFTPFEAGVDVYEYCGDTAVAEKNTTSGKYEIKGIGTAKVYIGVGKSIAIYTIDAYGEVTDINNLPNDTVELKINETGTLLPVIVPTTAQGGTPITFISSNSAVLTINNNGEYKGLKEGQATVTVTAGGISKTVDFTVSGLYTTESDATLTRITIDGDRVSNFSSSKLSYNHIVSKSVIPDSVPVVATTNVVSATYTVDRPSSIPGDIKIIVTAEDGSKLTYTVRIMYENEDDYVDSTLTYVEDRIDFSDILYVDTIVIEELGREVLYNGTITLTAPSGFEWDLSARVSGTGALRGVSDDSVTYGRSGNDGRDKRSLKIKITDMDDVRSLRGILYINDLVLVPLDNADYGTVRIRISGCGMRSANLNVGYYEKDGDKVSGNIYTGQTFTPTNRTSPKVIVTAFAKYAFDGTEYKELKYEPYLSNGVFMVAAQDLNSIFVGLGSFYNSSEQSFSYYTAYGNAKLVAWDKRVYGTGLVMSVAPEIRNNTLYVPIKVVAESLGYTVAWDATNKTVIMNKASE